MKNLTEHWNQLYSGSDDDKLGWFENDFTQTMKFLGFVNNWKKSRIFIAGAGTSTLAGELLKSEAKLILNDISTEVIDRLREDYNKFSDRVYLNHQDLSKPLSMELGDVDIWIDRAVLHFIVDDDQISRYFSNVNDVVKPGGYALFAEFSKKGAKKCAGLDVRQYDIHDFKDYLSSFQLISSEEYTYINPKGEPRPYIYALFLKQS